MTAAAYAGAQGSRSVDLDALYAASNIGEILDQLDRELVGLVPVKSRIREIAALLLIDQARRQLGLSTDRAVAAHELHRQSRHRQDDGGAADGRHPAPAGLYPARPCGVGHPRRPGRPVYRPHRAQDQGSAEEGDGRRAVHRRGLLPLPAGERARLRAGGDRDPASGDGEPARRSGGDPGRLQGPDGHLLLQQSRAWDRASRTTSISRITGRTSCWRSPSGMLAPLHYRFDPARVEALREYIELRMRPAAFRQRAHDAQRARPRPPAPGQPAVRPAAACWTPTCSRRSRRPDIRASRVFTQ